LSLADLQSRTKVRAKYLSALEAERYEDLPPFPYARGFVLAAAEELSLDPDPLIARLRSAMTALPAAEQGDWSRLDGAVRPAVRRSKLRRLVTILGGTLIITAIAMAVYFAQQLRQFSQPAPPPAPPPTATPAPAATPDASAQNPGSLEGAGPGARPVPAAVAPAPGTAPEAATPAMSAPRDLTLTGTEGLTLDVIVAGVSWIRVVADGRAAFEGLLRDETRQWQARRTLVVRVGNGGAVSGTVNGQQLGTFGGNGEVVDRTFTLAPP
jgi:hypothetical protein